MPNPQSGPKRLDRCQPEMFSVQWSDSRWGCSSFPLTQAANFCLYMCRQWTLFLLARRPMKLLSGRDAFHCTHRKTNALRMSPLSCPPPFPMTAGSIEYKGAGRPIGSPQIATKYCDAIRSLLAFWPLSPSFQNAANCLILAEREGFYRPLRGRKLSPPSVSKKRRDDQDGLSHRPVSIAKVTLTCCRSACCPGAMGTALASCTALNPICGMATGPASSTRSTEPTRTPASCA